MSENIVSPQSRDAWKQVTPLMRQSQAPTLSVIHQLGGEEAIRDPNAFAEGLKTIFEEQGAELILKSILQDLSASSEKP